MEVIHAGGGEGGGGRRSPPKSRRTAWGGVGMGCRGNQQRTGDDGLGGRWTSPWRTQEREGRGSSDRGEHERLRPPRCMCGPVCAGVTTTTPCLLHTTGELMRSSMPSGASLRLQSSTTSKPHHDSHHCRGSCQQTRQDKSRSAVCLQGGLFPLSCFQRLGGQSWLGDLDGPGFAGTAELRERF